MPRDCGKCCVGDPIPRHHAWSDDHHNVVGLHHLLEGHDLYVMRTLDTVIQLWRVKFKIHLRSLNQRFFPLEGNAMLHAVNHDVVHGGME